MTSPTVSSPTLAECIDALLPQTQCEQCGYHGCRAYAEAIARGEADINRCPPGGEAGIEALARLLQRQTLPLDASRGANHPRQLARIVEDDCIGCTKCIQACPVDAIIGAAKLMHTVIADRCTGCELCVVACPVDCIDLIPMPTAQLDAAHADAARCDFEAREARLTRARRERTAQLAARKAAIHATPDSANAQPRSIAQPLGHGAVMAAIARAHAKRAARDTPHEES